MFITLLSDEALAHRYQLFPSIGSDKSGDHALDDSAQGLIPIEVQVLAGGLIDHIEQGKNDAADESQHISGDFFQ